VERVKNGVADWLDADRLAGRFATGDTAIDGAVLVLLAAGTYGLGAALEREFPGLGTSGPQMLVWGFCISTIVNYHATYTINPLSHVFGRRRFATRDTSRNNWLLAVITLGEGWHNNHHHFSASARQGFYWWGIDVTYYILT
jgi:stearoyl-CoA desaturase (delta-9 desaturase)